MGKTLRAFKLQANGDEAKTPQLGRKLIQERKITRNGSIRGDRDRIKDSVERVLVTLNVSKNAFKPLVTCLVNLFVFIEQVPDIHYQHWP